MSEQFTNRLEPQSNLPNNQDEKSSEGSTPLEGEADLEAESSSEIEIYELVERAADFGKLWADNRMMLVFGEEYLLVKKDQMPFTVIDKDGYIIEELVAEFSCAQEDAYWVEYALSGQTLFRSDGHDSSG